MRQGEAVFVDSGAWIALALSRDPLHAQAREQWDLLHGAGAKLHTSVPVVIETFTFLDRNANRDVALTWKESIHALQGPTGRQVVCRRHRSLVLGEFGTTNGGNAQRCFSGEVFRTPPDESTGSPNLSAGERLRPHVDLFNLLCYFQ